MDVSEWTVDQRMRLPDWCFGNRQLVGIHVDCPNLGTFYYGISEIALPDPVCIWSFGFYLYNYNYTRHRFRVGLRESIPTNEAEMDTATEILPYFGEPRDGPNYIRAGTLDTRAYLIPLRKGMVTGGNYLVASCYTGTDQSMVDIFLVVSGLPTSMAGWLAHNRV